MAVALCLISPLKLSGLEKIMPLANLDTIAELLRIEFRSLFVEWGNSTPTRTGLHASAVLVDEQDWCLRRHTLSELFPDAVQPIELSSWDWKQQAIFLNGWRLHEKWQALFQQFARVVEVETSHFDEDRNLYFTPDVIFEFGNQKYIVEIKGYKADYFAKLDESGAPPEYAHAQANLYCHLLRIDKAIILVENKDTQDFKLWLVEYNPKLAMPPVKRIYDVKRAVALTRRNLEKLPERICQSRDDARARKCPMRDTCFLRLREFAENQSNNSTENTVQSDW
jgi:hypothetical protein